MRLFIAIDIDQATKEVIATALRFCQHQLPFLSWTTPDQWHITLAFLGEVDETEARFLREGLKDVVAEPFAMEVGGIGVFPHWGNPRVFWAGIDDHPAMQRLYDRLWVVLRERGVVPDGKPFHPHLTLGRIKRFLDPGDKKLLQAVSIPRRSVSVVDFHLYRSELHPDGARYTKIQTYPLKESFDG